MKKMKKTHLLANLLLQCVSRQHSQSWSVLRAIIIESPTLHQATCNINDTRPVTIEKFPEAVNRVAVGRHHGRWRRIYHWEAQPDASVFVQWTAVWCCLKHWLGQTRLEFLYELWALMYVETAAWIYCKWGSSMNLWPGACTADDWLC